MDLSKLELMTTDALQAIRDKCAEVLKKRAGLAIRHGVVAWFMDSSGKKRFMRIARINPKSVSGYEVDPDSHFRMGKTSWKVGQSLLNPVVDKEQELKLLQVAQAKLAREQKTAASVAKTDKPVADYESDAW